MNRLTIALADGGEEVFQSQWQTQGFSAEQLPNGDLIVMEHDDQPEAEQPPVEIARFVANRWIGFTDSSV